MARMEIARPGRPAQSGEIAVAVDVIRFATTASVLLDRSREVHIGPPSDAAVLEWQKLNPGGLVFAEKNGLVMDSADFDNSPAQALEADLGERPILLASTNGAPLLLGLPAGRAWLACITNITATAELLRKLGSATDDAMVLYPASLGFEDEWFCQALAELTGDPKLSAMELLGGRERVFRRLAEKSGRDEADLWLCADIDRYPHPIRLEAKLNRTYGLLRRDDYSAAGAGLSRPKAV